ncbi:MAG: galactonate dehydratase, partial [Glaciecola sp.]
PFDELAEETDGHTLLPGDIDKGLEPLRKIREAVGMKIDVAIELHSRWTLTAAKRIAKACEPYEPMWFEDPLRVDNVDALAEFARSTRIPTIASELVSGKTTFKAMLDTGAFGYIMFDFGWVGGLSEARKIGVMADAHHLPVAPHDCTGPVNFALGVHFGVSQHNVMFQEIVRAYYHDWFGELVTELPRLENGYLYPLEGPGMGLELKQGIVDRPDATVRVSN